MSFLQDGSNLIFLFEDLKDCTESVLSLLMVLAMWTKFARISFAKFILNFNSSNCDSQQNVLRVLLCKRYAGQWDTEWRGLCFCLPSVHSPIGEMRVGSNIKIISTIDMFVQSESFVVNVEEGRCQSFI